MLLVLLVENETPAESAAMGQGLAGQDCRVHPVSDLNVAADRAQTEWPDLVVINVASGLRDAGELCRALDSTRLDLPRLVVHFGDIPRHLGAQAYLEVPFTARKLAFRIRKAIGDGHDRFFRLGDIVVDRARRVVKHQDRIEDLTPKQMRLLTYLMSNQGCAVDRKQIMRNVWDTEYTGDTRTLEVHIRWLREKLEFVPQRPEHIITVRRSGYMFKE